MFKETHYKSWFKLFRPRERVFKQLQCPRPQCVKRTPLCGCCWDPRSRNWWIKEFPKRGIFGSFSYDRTKACICANGAYFELKRKVFVFLMFLRFIVKSVLKLLDRTVYFPEKYLRQEYLKCAVPHLFNAS